MTERRPGEGRYAHVEREQRWLASEVPPDARFVAEITDRYLAGTRLRLRRTEAGGDVVLKLGQKVRVDTADPEVVKLTNMYLSGEEYDVLTSLPAAELHKTRWHVPWHDRTVAVDQFRGRHLGLLLAEAELEPFEAPLPQPVFALRDVTHDDRFAGGSLALASDDTIDRLLHEARLA